MAKKKEEPQFRYFYRVTGTAIVKTSQLENGIEVKLYQRIKLDRHFDLVTESKPETYDNLLVNEANIGNKFMKDTVTDNPKIVFVTVDSIEQLGGVPVKKEEFQF